MWTQIWPLENLRSDTLMTVNELFWPLTIELAWLNRLNKTQSQKIYIQIKLQVSVRKER